MVSGSTGVRICGTIKSLYRECPYAMHSTKDDYALDGPLSTGPSLDTCQACGGCLELVDGTDPDIALDTQQWGELYECASCGGKGEYRVDERNGINESYTGVTVR